MAKPRWLLSVCGIALATCAIELPAAVAQNGPPPVTATITLGSHEGAAHPTRHGHAMTGGGTINVVQPAPDTLVVTMTGNAAASSSAFVAAESAVDFFERLQFHVQFSEPGHLGKLIVQAKVNGLVRSQGNRAVVGMSAATATVSCGPSVLTTVALPQRMLGGCDALAVNAAQGPVCVPAAAGCYSLQQNFRIAASQQAGGLGCHKASAEFSPSQLPSSWTGQSYPFKDIDKSGLGYQVTLRVIASPAGAEPDSSAITTVPPPHVDRESSLIFPGPPINVATAPGRK